MDGDDWIYNCRCHRRAHLSRAHLCFYGVTEMTVASADGISLILSEDARIENGHIVNMPYVAVKIAEAVESGIYNGFKMHEPNGVLLPNGERGGEA